MAASPGIYFSVVLSQNLNRYCVKTNGSFITKNKWTF
jgi:hypothetical protein